MILLFFLVGSGLKEPMENLMQMVILSGCIVEGVSRIDNILRQQEADQDGAGDPTMFDVEFSDVEFAYTEGIRRQTMYPFICPRELSPGWWGLPAAGNPPWPSFCCGSMSPQRGTIRIGGVDIPEIPPARLMELVAYVFQDSVLFTDTIENNIRMGNTKATMEEVEQAARNAGIHEVIQALPQGYQTVVGRDDAYLSGGEKQRLAIARVFLKDAPIIILDEATAYADAENEAKVQAAFAKLAQNKTVLMIAHRMKTVERADQILVMDKGKLVGTGTHEELLTGCETYKRLVDAICGGPLEYRERSGTGMRFREWFQMMTLGHPGKYLRLMAWCLFDSIVVSVPYGLMLGAVYFLLALWQNQKPHSQPGHSGGLPPGSWPS